MKIKKDSLITWSSLIVAILLWASAFVEIRVGLKGYSPGGLALFRFLIASFCMSIIYFYRMHKGLFRPIHSKDLYLLAILGAIGLGIYNVALNYGEITLDSGIASFIISQSPLLTIVFAVIFLKERLTKNCIFGVLISILGISLLSYGETHKGHLNIGILYVLIAAIISGFYSVMQKPFLKKYHAVDVTAYIIWGGTLALCIYFPAMLNDIKTASLTATLATIYLGIFPAAIAYLAWSYALSAITVAKAASFLYFMPIIATILGFICLGEIPTLFAILGGIIALFGVWLANI